MLGIKNTEVNTKRQKELDLAKGFLMIMIIVIHSFQLLANADAKASDIYHFIFSCFMTSGACLYLFSMGFGSVYSKNNSPKQLSVSGIKLLWYQLLSNICYAGVIVVFYNICKLTVGNAEGSDKAYDLMIEYMLTFVNIFFIAGMCYLVMAMYKALRMPVYVYAISAVAVSIISPYANKLKSDNKVLKWILDMTFGGPGKTSFCFFPYISLVFAGYIFAKVLRRVEDKVIFYRTVGIISGVVMATWLGILIAKYGSLTEFYMFIHVKYRIPDFFKLVGSTATIITTMAIAYALIPLIEKISVIDKFLCYLSKNISKYYAIHIGVYAAVGAVYSFKGVGTIGCLIWAVIAFVITDVIVRVYIAVENKIIKNKK